MLIITYATPPLSLCFTLSLFTQHLLSSKFASFRKWESCQLGVKYSVARYKAPYFLHENETFSNKTKVFKDGSTKVERTVHVGKLKPGENKARRVNLPLCWY